MTIGNGIIKWINVRFNACFLPFHSPSGEFVDKQNAHKHFVMVRDPSSGFHYIYLNPEDVTVITIDAPLIVRSVRFNKIHDDDKNYIRTLGDLAGVLGDLVKRFLLRPNIRRVVICMDDIGGNPAAKAGITGKRSHNRNDVPPDLVFEDETEFAGFDIHDIWYSRTHRIQFTEYLTRYFIEFKDILENKQLVIDGGRLPDHNDNLCVLVETGPRKTEINSYNSCYDLRARIMRRDEPGFEACGKTPEGEAKAVAHAIWSGRTDSSVVMISNDGDCFFACILQWRLMLDSRGDPLNNYYIQRKKSMGVQDYSAEDKEKILRRHNNGGDEEPAKKKPRLSRVVYTNQYILVNEMVKGIKEYFEEMKCSTPHPLETFALLAALEGNDYVEKLPWLSFERIMKFFEQNHQRIGDLVSVATDERDKSGKLNKYVVQKEALVRLAYLLYVEKHKKLASYDVDVYADPYGAYEKMLEKVQENKMKSKFPSLANLHRCAHNLAYYLSYFGNSSVHGYTFPSGLEKDDDGFSLYGYGIGDEEKGSHRENIVLCDNVTPGSGAYAEYKKEFTVPKFNQTVLRESSCLYVTAEISDVSNAFDI